MRYLRILQYYWLKLCGWRKTHPVQLMEQCAAIDANPDNHLKIKVPDGYSFRTRGIHFDGFRPKRTSINTFEDKGKTNAISNQVS